MNNKINIELGQVQMTLLMPVWARAAESKKEKPLIHDSTAIEIIDSIDFDFSKMAANLKEINQLSWIARSRRYDMIIEEFIKNHPSGTIVNIGCGLDTTYERAKEKPVMWFDLDLPDVIDLRKKFLKESDHHRFLSGSFLDTSWFKQIPKSDKILFISAGVFVYYEEEVIKSFLITLADHFPDAALLFDVTSSKGLEVANQVIKAAGLPKEAYFKWALSNRSVLQTWDPRLQLVNTYYTFKLPGLKMKLKDRVHGFLSDSAGVQYMVHLHILDK